MNSMTRWVGSTDPDDETGTATYTVGDTVLVLGELFRVQRVEQR